ncbi:MAG: hypothetical protein Ct9H90mP4_08340 [Gammaproteobacteria bacterium]|nr:MAG: hypothetical protein Ct9H90mP4_08340 [Gammaproteobacteria bacterium]
MKKIKCFIEQQKVFINLHENTSVTFIFSTNSLYSELITDLKVKWVVDGDTVHAIKGDKLYKIRLTEIDAPERDQPYGAESTRLLKLLLKDGYFNADISVLIDMGGI